MSDATAQPARSVDRIDVHAHFVPDFYKDALLAAGIARPDGFPMPTWDARNRRWPRWTG